MNKELAWLMLPVVGMLSQLGGTYNKLFRRIGVPFVITAFSALLCGFSLWTPVLFLCLLGAMALPFTLLGSDIRDHWFNWLWIWAAGYLLGLPSVVLGREGLWLAIAPCLAQGLCGTLSNLKSTNKLFDWKFCEGAVWLFVAYPYAYLIRWC